MFYVRIPVDRVGVLIGEQGRTKARLEELTGVKITVDSNTGEVTIDETGAKDPTFSLKVRDVVTAIGRGFSEEKAFLLMDDDMYVQVFDIKEFASDSKDRLAQIKGRVIGAGGKTRRLLEELAGVDISVSGHTVAIIGDAFHLDIGRQAMEMLLGGSEHKTVYRFLERKRLEIKAYEKGL